MVATVIKKNTVRINCNSILASRNTQVMKTTNESNPKLHQAITKIRTIVHITSQFKQVTLKTKIKPTEYAH